MPNIDPVRTQENASELVKFSLVSTGTYLSTKVLLRLVKNPVLLFGTGLVAGFYLHKNRQQIMGTLLAAKEQSTQFLSNKSSD
ncbi:MAG: hypothetical protein NTV00_15050 [Methylococcales bacterium]|nr:hypothetical protein [Methylococcales bacterium]